MKDAPQLSQETADQCKTLYWCGWSIKQLSDTFGVAYGTLDSRKRREAWDKASPVEQAKACLDIRYKQLILKDLKTALELQELNSLGKEMERLARVDKYLKTQKESDLNPKLNKRNEGRQKKKNLITDDMAVKLQDDFYDNLFGYQDGWFDAKKKYRIRNVLKSRQIGATWYFAREAFIDALETGDNQIFLSASKAQAYVFRAYITIWVQEITGVELKGDPIVLPNGASLYFLSTNSRTAQSYHGHVYMDEYFWIPRFKDFNKVASGMAMHSKWRKTYFSTPSTLNHEAYPFWNGKHYNRGRPIADHIEIDISHAALRSGVLCADGQWRQIVTVLDAVENGCNLFNVDELRTEYSPEEFDNLLMCIFVDDAASVFRLDDLQRCTCDSLEKWTDYNQLKLRPFGNKEVWIGYDPSRTGDDASLAVIAPPDVPGGKYRLLETYSWNNIDFEEQALKVQQLTKRFNVTKIVVDSSGIGHGVYELVRKFFPAAISLKYSVEVKSQLVLQAMQLVRRRSIEWDAGLRDVMMAFMTIKKTITPSGAQTTFKASRTEATGHADRAWAIMHAFFGQAMQALEGSDDSPQEQIVEVF